MGAIMDILQSAGFGSLLGGIFGWLSKREERENMKLKYDFQISMLEAKTNATIEVAKMGIEEAKTAGALLVEKVEAQAFKESQKTSAIGATIKAIVRPAILAVLLYQTYIILNSLEELTGGLGSLPPADVVDLYKITILSIIALTSMAVGWYFAARTSKQFDKLLEHTSETTRMAK